MKLACALLFVASTASLSRAEESWLPLKSGAKWTYSYVQENGNEKSKTEGTATLTCGAVATLDGDKAALTWSLAIKDEKPSSGVETVIVAGDTVQLLAAEWKFWVMPADFKEGTIETTLKIAGVEVKWKSTTGKQEEVETPAGKYKAVPVTMEQNNGLVRRTTTVWYARGVGVVKVTEHAHDRDEGWTTDTTLVLTKHEAPAAEK